jgi:hypothetical protein
VPGGSNFTLTSVFESCSQKMLPKIDVAALERGAWELNNKSKELLFVSTRTRR